ncbi:MAG: DUF1573 domain-containing protein [Chitinophagaceae bacterium]|jgi:hypothetical protein|nr:DUF1573 domain-containing protein [Chitinophagaceae bacterium]
MKLFLSILLTCFSSTLLLAQVKVDDRIRFEKTEHNFGKIPQGKPVTISFTFSNPSNERLMIQDATAECGCTTPEYPTKPITTGKTGTITVTYDAKEPGAFTKRITVRLINVAEPKILTIKGEVVKQK